MLPVYLFDDNAPLLEPLTGLRASFEVRLGPFSLLEYLMEDRIRPEGLLLWGLFVPPHLQPLLRERTGLLVNELRSGGTDTAVLLLNGRCATPDWPRLRAMRPGTMIIEAETEAVVAACVPETIAPRVLRGDRNGFHLEATEKRSLVSRPWHARTFRDAAIEAGLEACVRSGLYARVREAGGATMIGAVWAAPDAKVLPGAILDAAGGPIVLAERATVRPGAIIIGPAFVGRSATVLERGTLRAHTAIGPWCKVNGEVAGVVFQGYSNKAHDGFLGDSWVGEWVNLGAGTTNSNLLNTYGEVVARAATGEGNERTGEQFLGAIIGDHVKTAICTRIMTGAVIHTGSMLAASAPATGCIPPFAWITDDARRTYRLSKFLEVMRAAMARRGVSPSDAYLARVQQLHALACGDQTRSRA
jgi:UDP-N-acetylglucosamine diphosphorylase / glucose-1-phosphate thymidylyltransferase / UDP-N-acetylgalactosamine diphosphorylase / glucosamine-1-phosphate N-acetyltransferase / galactosamine-1-phosphate N-acetyltransferase